MDVSDKMDRKGEIKVPKLDSNCKQRSVTSSRLGRAVQFTSLFAGLTLGTASEYTKSLFGWSDATDMQSAMLSPQNMERIVDKLCQLRGAALKLGQVISMQDPKTISPQLIEIFDRVRQSADYMPDSQVMKIMCDQFGNEWQTKFKAFDDKPFAAASIGQVHCGILHNDVDVAIKIQYLDISKSIESDLNNLIGMLRFFNLFPPGAFIDDVIEKLKRELAWEVDYLREGDFQTKYRDLIVAHHEFYVPKVYDELTTTCVLTTELVSGITVDKCFELDYEHRQFIGMSLLKLVFIELFEMKCMQPDSNWSNYLYEQKSKRIMLLDFGASRFYSDEFINNYKEFLRASVADDRDKLYELLIKMKFLTEDDSEVLVEAHMNAAMMFGEIFRNDGDFDFGEENLSERLSVEVAKMIEQRMSPPPEEVYSINRKISGIVSLCSKLNIKINCRQIYNEIIERT
ncbi:atypical kinase COQ8B, mitochondrial-like [Contarinia nasturtii]|uniref:atypical kinase COQ8B, mitochondrial-like n=1 Tax=Contarinia nasturtii TaxID=265458 RepID=UPI0012D39017|nr:atypical kinase COQ8B, mitochondrial-like [Contarinia nasturtii]